MAAGLTRTWLPLNVGPRRHFDHHGEFQFEPERGYAGFHHVQGRVHSGPADFSHPRACALRLRLSHSGTTTGFLAGADFFFADLPGFGFFKSILPAAFFFSPFFSIALSTAASTVFAVTPLWTAFFTAFSINLTAFFFLPILDSPGPRSVRTQYDIGAGDQATRRLLPLAVRSSLERDGGIICAYPRV